MNYKTQELKTAAVKAQQEVVNNAKVTEVVAAKATLQEIKDATISE